MHVRGRDDIHLKREERSRPGISQSTFGGRDGICSKPLGLGGDGLGDDVSFLVFDDDGVIDIRLNASLRSMAKEDLHDVVGAP